MGKEFRRIKNTRATTEALRAVIAQAENAINIAELSLNAVVKMAQRLELGDRPDIAELHTIVESGKVALGNIAASREHLQQVKGKI